jgi:hypothetical protein
MSGYSFLCNKISGKYDLFGWHKYNQITAGVCRRPMLESRAGARRFVAVIDSPVEFSATRSGGMGNAKFS